MYLLLKLSLHFGNIKKKKLSYDLKYNPYFFSDFMVFLSDLGHCELTLDGQTCVMMSSFVCSKKKQL